MTRLPRHRSLFVCRSIILRAMFELIFSRDLADSLARALQYAAVLKDATAPFSAARQARNFRRASLHDWSESRVWKRKSQNVLEGGKEPCALSPPQILIHINPLAEHPGKLLGAGFSDASLSGFQTARCCYVHATTSFGP
jgi:hypothetical protein